MAHLRAQFEKEIRHRLQLKSQQHLSEEQVLLKSFKYYDLDDRSTVTFQQFLKVVEKLGFQIFDQKNLVDIFKYYTENSQVLDYKKLAIQIFHNNSVMSRRFSPTKDKPIQGNIFDPKHPEELLLKLRKKIQQSGSDIILRMIDLFLKADIKNTKLVSRDIFNNILESLRFQISQEEIRTLFIYFDRHQQRLIDYEEFIIALRGPLNGCEFFEKIFFTLSEGGKYLDIDKILEIYADYVNEQKYSHDLDILEQFQENIKIYIKFRNIGNKKFNQQQFVEFNILVHFDKHEQQNLQKFMQQIWNPSFDQKIKQNIKYLSQINNIYIIKKNFYQISFSQIFQNKTPNKSSVEISTPMKKLQFNDTSSQSSISSQNNRIIIQDILAKISNQLSKRGPKAYISLQKYLIQNQDIDKNLSLSQFKKALQNYRVDITENEIDKLFSNLDSMSMGSIKLDLFMKQLLGDFDKEKIELVQYIFNQLDTDHDDIIQINDLKKAFNPKYHPDVRQGKKSESEILAEFIDSYDSLHTIYTFNRDQKISRQEFLSYYHIMAKIHQNIQDFDAILRGCFKTTLIEQTKQIKNAQSQLTQNYMLTSAPYGMSDIPVDYTSSSKLVRKQNISDQPAGISSWPGFGVSQNLTTDKKI